MQLALETQVLYELALSIGESGELLPMLRHTLSELLRLTNGNGAFVVQFGEGSRVGEATAPARHACLLPRNLERNAAFQEFTREWPPEALYPTLIARSEHEPLTVPLQDGTAHALLLPQFGYLVFFRRQAPLAETFLRAFGPLARKLGSTARSCVLEEELRRQSWRLELATSAAHIGVWQFEVATGRLTWDAEMLRLFGITADVFGGTREDFVARVHADDRERTARHFDALVASADRFEFEFAIQRPDGARRQLLATGRVQRGTDGTPLAIVGINVDITARKETEDALRRARDLAEATNQAKSQFIANMSHELRTPLNGIIGMTELALASGVDDTQREYLRVARSSADGLLTILNDILDLSKIDAGEMRVERMPFSLPVVVTDAVKSLTLRARQQHLQLVLDLPAELPTCSLGDPGRLRQILLNLCDNALKFTAHGTIVVRVRAERLGDEDLVSIDVQDSGIGIPAEKTEQIFEAFQQGDASITRRFGGTGLGLSISRRLAGLMNGQLTVISVPGEGSTFTLTLPLPRARAPLDPALSPSARDGRHAPLGDAPLAEGDGDRLMTTELPRSPRVLLVEDNVVNRAVAEGMLTTLGYHVSIATNGQEALDRLETEPFDLVFMDVQMPVLDGIAATRAIRQREGASRRTPIVAMTANAMADEKALCLSAGMDDHLAKPVRLAVLQDVLQRYAPR